MSESKTVKPFGRPLSKSGKKAKKDIETFIEVHTGRFTTADIRKHTKHSQTTVRNRLNALIRDGKIKTVDSVPVEKDGQTVRGRPISVYERVKK